MQLTKTIKVQLYPSASDIEKFEETQQQFLNACNFVSTYIFDHDFELGQTTLHNALYHQIRQDFGLQSQMAQSVMRTVIARYKTVKTQFKQKPKRYKDIHTGKYHTLYKDLYHLTKPLGFKRPVAVFVRNRNYAYHQDDTYSLTTNQGRIKVSCDKQHIAYLQQFSQNAYKFGQAELLCRKGKWFLHVSASKEIDNPDEANIQRIVGIDRGLRQILTIADDTAHTTFYSGKNLIKKRRHFMKLRQSLQAKNTKSSRRRLKTIERRENRWMNDVNHQLSKTLVDRYGANTLFVVEDLTNVTFNTTHHRKQDARYEHHSWRFFDFEEKLMYKALESGSQVLKVSAQFTSQRCPKCESIDKANRQQDKHLFTCQNCGYQSNDDRVAAINIKELGHRYLSSEKNPRFEKVVPIQNY